MKLHLEILPPAQLLLWKQLVNLPKSFTLYGGTAIALQIGHRESVDFDFFSAEPLNREKLITALPFLETVSLTQPEINTLNCFVETELGNVKFQFLCGLSTRLARVNDPIQAEDNGIYIASLMDLFATKLHTIQARAEKKDYIDIYFLLRNHYSLAEGLASAKAVFGLQFDPASTLKAMCYFNDGDLNELDNVMKDTLRKAAKNVDQIPQISAKNKTIAFSQ